MSGMNRAVRIDNPIIVTAFHTSLEHQLLIIFVVLVVLSLLWNVVRTVQYRRAVAAGNPGAPVSADARSGSPVAPPAGTHVGTPVATQVDTPLATSAESGHAAPNVTPLREPVARLVLRIGFGLLWTLDGLLQLQASMPLGLPSGAFQSSSAGSPGWVQGLVHVASSTWLDHPITAATAAVWIQLGVGLGLLVAPRGRWSRAAGLLSVGWGLVVWVFGESFGGIFGPGASFLFGTPGAALLYVAAGALLALPEARWRTATLGRRLLQVAGAFFIGMSVLQAWPGRGSWTGQPSPRSTPGSLTAMVQTMSQVPQPSPLRSLLHSFGTLDAAHGWAVNLVVVILLAVVGICLCARTSRIVAVGVVGGIAVCLADWVLVQDLGVFGGLGTDPNSMVPLVVLLGVGYLALVRPGAGAVAVDTPARAGAAGRFDRLSPAYLLQCTGALLALAVVLIGAAPMAIAATNPHADPIDSEVLANNGNVEATNFPAWGFSLVNQDGRPAKLRSLRGHVVVLTFLDPVCTSDCPLMAQEIKSADAQLGPSTPAVEFVAIDANPGYRSPSALRSFDTAEQLAGLSNWEFVTGSVAQLDPLWIDYGVDVETGVDGSMSSHQDLLFFLDPNGRVRDVVSADPGDTTTANSSLATVIVDQVRSLQSTT